MMEYLDHWGFADRPFENNRNVRFFYPGPQHVEALERLLYLVRDGNMCFGLLTGEIGAGKTMVLHQFMERLHEKDYLRIHIPNGNMEFEDLLREILFYMERRPTSRHRRGFSQPQRDRKSVV
jgi:general secretion pathway protein A